MHICTRTAMGIVRSPWGRGQRCACPPVPSRTLDYAKPMGQRPPVVAPCPVGRAVACGPSCGVDEVVGASDAATRGVARLGAVVAMSRPGAVDAENANANFEDRPAGKGGSADRGIKKVDKFAKSEKTLCRSTVARK